MTTWDIPASRCAPYIMTMAPRISVRITADGRCSSAREPRLRDILVATEEITGQHVTRTETDRRGYFLCRARMVFYAAARTLTNKSLAQIARACAAKDHTTVLHGVRRVMASRDEFEPHLSMVLARFQSDLEISK